ncbi:hypothetical protein P7D22_02050 [Lichenihabitans sp. Uapishka_5]|uniref:COG3904 family protein n=1 Tax=Lichenihabitans sp. Uapishka_5 TaxID=3037302 RepID=UPI0029E807C6|nr:hypothetical protein [Lichenihabitans sp. Uapishka_5]MDX7949957.1 hypothetical protein [Lichenihabitans sp. Uapishka_5]
MNRPVAVRLVRSSDPRCAPDRCAEWIAVEGPIGPGSAAAFARIARLAGRAPHAVLIDSPGGLVSEAMAIGRMVRERHLDVVVARTILTLCPADRDACGTLLPNGIASGRPDPRQALCASACPLILAAGTRRFVSPQAHVGVHEYLSFARKVKVMRTYRIVTRTMNGVRQEVSRTLVSERPLPDTAVTVQTRSSYGDTASYYTRMGIGAGLMPLLRAAPAAGMSWLTPDELAATRLATASGDDEDLAPRAVFATELKPVPVGPPPGSLDPNAPHEIAALVDEAGTAVTSYGGHATWSVQRITGTSDTPASIDLVAAVSLDDDAGTLSFRISRTESGRAPSLHLTVRMLHGGSSPFRHILALEAPGLRKDAHALPDPFLGRSDPSPPAVLDMVLSDVAESAERDLALLAVDQWIDVPIMVDQARTIRMSFAIGASGGRAIRDWEAAQVLRAAK